MSYVKPLDQNSASKASQPILKAIEEKFGQSLNIFNTLAYQPDVLRGVTQVNDGVRNDLPEKLRELAYFKCSQLNGCNYCSHYHRGAAREAGISEEQLEAIENFAISEKFNEHEKAVLSYSEQLTKKSDVEKQTVEKLKAFLDDKQLVTLAATVALANFTNRFNHGLGIELP